MNNCVHNLTVVFLLNKIRNMFIENHQHVWPIIVLIINLIYECLDTQPSNSKPHIKYRHKIANRIDYI